MARPILINKEQFSLNVNGCSFFNDGDVYTTKTQSDGKILVGGPFINYNGVVGRDRLVRLNADGSVDESFCVNASDGLKFNDAVYSIDIQTSGKILVSGSFFNYNGTTRDHLIRLNTNGTLDTTFNVYNEGGLQSLVYIKVQPDDQILVYTNLIDWISETISYGIVRLSQDGSTLDVLFTQNANGSLLSTGNFNGGISTIELQPNGKILVGGNFTNYPGGTSRNRLIRLNNDGTTDNDFCVAASDGGKFNNQIYSITVQPDGKILVGGIFTSYPGGVNRNRFIRLNSNGTIDNDFCVAASDGGKFNSNVLSIAVQSDDKILVGGAFTNYAGAGGKYLVRLNTNGTLDTSTPFSTTFLNFVYVSVDTINNKINIRSSAYQNGFYYKALMRFNNNDNIDIPFSNLVGGISKFTYDSSTNIYAINKVVKHLDGYIIAGDFKDYGEIGRDHLIRVNAEGNIDSEFCNNASGGAKFKFRIVSIAVQSDNKILVGGDFINYDNFTGRNRLIRLNVDGTLDTSFCSVFVDGSKFSDTVNDLAIDSSNRVLIAGNFTNYNGAAGRNCLIRINSNDTLDTSFCVNASDNKFFTNPVGSTSPVLGGSVWGIKIKSDGKIAVFGSFANSTSIFSGRSIRIINDNGTTSLSSTDNLISRGSFVRAAAWANDGSLLIGGNFGNLGGVSQRNYLGKFLPNTLSVDNSFCANASDGSKFNGTVKSLMIGSDGKISVFGNFTNYNGISNADYAVKLTSNGNYDSNYSNYINTTNGKIDVIDNNLFIYSESVNFKGAVIKFDSLDNII